MVAWAFAIGLALVAADGPHTAADAVTLRDGHTVLGQVVESSPRGRVELIVRRAWIEAHAPEVVKRWEAAERSAAARALTQRRARLEAWKRERKNHVEPDDRILAWIDRELDRLDPRQPPASVLMAVSVPTAEIRKMARQPKHSGRLLRLGWLAGFKNVEEMPLDALADALEGRGHDPNSTAPVSVERLLPLPVETDARWLARRAATEVTYDSGLRFIRVQQLVVPEPVPGQPLDAKSALSALPDVAKLLAGEAADMLPPRLREVADRGRVGAVVTRQETSPGFDTVTVERALWVRGPGDRWAPFGARSVTVATAAVKPGEAEELAEDPQVAAAFRIVESLGLGQVPADVRQKSLSVGAATRKALRDSQNALQAELAKLALDIEDRPEPMPKDGP